VGATSAGVPCPACARLLAGGGGGREPQTMPCRHAPHPAAAAAVQLPTGCRCPRGLHTQCHHHATRPRPRSRTWRPFSFLMMPAISGSTSDSGPSYCSSSFLTSAVPAGQQQQQQQQWALRRAPAASSSRGVWRGRRPPLLSCSCATPAQPPPRTLRRGYRCCHRPVDTHSPSAGGPCARRGARRTGMQLHPVVLLSGRQRWWC
jgi:hypothetical protein